MVVENKVEFLGDNFFSKIWCEKTVVNVAVLFLVHDPVPTSFLEVRCYQFTPLLVLFGSLFNLGSNEPRLSLSIFTPFLF